MAAGPLLKQRFELVHPEILFLRKRPDPFRKFQLEAAYIVRAVLQIRSAASACPEPKACAINIMNIISSFAWISQFTRLGQKSIFQLHFRNI